MRRSEPPRRGVKAVRLVTAAVTALVALVPADGGAQAKRHAASMEFGVSTVAFDARAAEVQGISPRAYGMRGGLSAALMQVVAVTADADLLLTSDQDKFTNSTTGGVKESSTGVWAVSLAGGLRTPLIGVGREGRAFTLGVDAGHSWLGGKRHIPECIDCDEEDLDFTGGSFLEPKLVFVGAEFGGFSVSYRVYGTAADLRNRLAIAWAVTGRF